MRQNKLGGKPVSAVDMFYSTKNHEFVVKLKKQIIWKTKAKAPGKVQKSQDVK